MIWQFIAKKKCRRQLQLVELLQQKCYSVAELAKKTKVSTKTILRDLYELQKKDYVIKRRYWQLRECYEANYYAVQRKILLENQHFQLFQQYLWNRGPRVNHSKIKELNHQLLRFNLSVNCQTGSLLGASALIFYLQLRYLRDFYQLEEAELYYQLDQKYPMNHSCIVKKELIPDERLLARFTQEFGLQGQLAGAFFLEYIGYHYQGCSEFYDSHQKHRTGLYQESKRAIALIEQAVSWETEVGKQVFTIKLFELFLGIRCCLPLAVLSEHGEQVEVGEFFLRLSRKLKRALPLLSNCRVDELAFALEMIFSASHHITLSLHPNLKSALVIQERFHPFFPCDIGKCNEDFSSRKVML